MVNISKGYVPTGEAWKVSENNAIRVEEFGVEIVKQKPVETPTKQPNSSTSEKMRPVEPEENDAYHFENLV